MTLIIIKLKNQKYFLYLIMKILLKIFIMKINNKMKKLINLIIKKMNEIIKNSNNIILITFKNNVF
jgi:hypothetical protein